ncbi:hypothetical protein MKW98_007973 [Papaver atlanticum]|uniref:Protein kinase domain-containing protein n=1 Tax=Papaver atlanticum TaxID=357466 RepID=A0AAD4X9T8_9MAGN|nr:hypothetical protein MKW98_007973 [Papaver atlanticum]
MKKSYSSLDECLELPEVKALTKLYGDPNIVGLRKVIYESEVLYLVFDYAESTLHRRMHDKIKNEIGLFSESEIRGWSRQILLALAQMHRPGGYMHRDLKPDNLLVTKYGELIKIADFGQAREIDSKSPCSDYVEVLLNSVSYTSAVDIWAVGAIMAELYSFRPLFPGKNRADQLYKICSVIGSPTYESWAEGMQLANSCGYNHEAIDLIKSLCSWEPKNRPTAMEALQHPYFAPNMCALPETTTSAKFEQRSEELFGPFSPVCNITSEEICFDAKLFGRFSPVSNITSEDLLKRYEFEAELRRLFRIDSSSKEADNRSAMTRQFLCAF